MDYKKFSDLTRKVEDQQKEIEEFKKAFEELGVNLEAVREVDFNGNGFMGFSCYRCKYGDINSDNSNCFKNNVLDLL